MKLGLVQTVQNGMYNFLQSSFSYTKEECLQMQSEMFMQNINLLQQAESENIDLLVTSECINYIRLENRNNKKYSDYFPTLEGSEITQLAQCAKNAKSWLVAGLAYRDANNIARNGALIFNRQGTLVQVYNKTHLVGDEPVVFTKGSALAVIKADFGVFGVCICWDLQFPELVRSLAINGADLVVCPTWGWEKNLYGRARAYENGIFVAAAMAVPYNSPICAERSPSSVIAPNGEEIAAANVQNAQLLLCDINLSETEKYKPERMADRQPQLYSCLLNEKK